MKADNDKVTGDRATRRQAVSSPSFHRGLEKPPPWAGSWLEEGLRRGTSQRELQGLLKAVQWGLRRLQGDLFHNSPRKLQALLKPP